ncbi:hypothetical protein GOP47_0025703 [Adiantum capillus-veneris]|uniref:Phosphorylated adapter RNA export protein n=1 Tax=Adiantum capillus-veneris TaxID=13818 RepID=A0A9D4U2J8_ADICA|nr:hypothetical protein GOP47_0025703 [Adiantum capillus-veneris]
MESLEPLWEYDDDLPDFDEANGQLQPAPAAQPILQRSPLEPLEDGEIDSATGSFHPGFSFQFTATNLDAAIQSSKRSNKAKKGPKRKGKKRKSKSKKAQEMNPRVFIARTSRFLKEPKHYLIEAAVERLGMDVVGDLVNEVETIEANGGQMIASGKRRRTPGGVLWNILKSRFEEDYKVIMAAGRTIEKEERKQKRKVEVDDMEMDGQPSGKRRRTGATTRPSMAPPEAQVKRTGVILWPSRCAQMDDIQFKVDPDNSRTLSHVQNAWTEAVKKGKHIAQGVNNNKKLMAGLNDIEMMDDAMNKRPSSIAERLRIPIEYNDL